MKRSLHRCALPLLFVAAMAPLAGTQGSPATAQAPSRELVPWMRGATPTLMLADLNNHTHTLAEYKGKTVVVNFWATWCEPCREEMPSLQRLARRMADRNLVVLTVDAGEAPERIRRFVAQTGIDLPVLLDRDSNTARAWQARVYPTSYVIGPDGQIRYYYVGALDWNADRVTRVLDKLR
jgi:thiol-disulfide isomerase/thioredoxin